MFKFQFWNNGHTCSLSFISIVQIYQMLPRYVSAIVLSEKNFQYNYEEYIMQEFTQRVLCFVAQQFLAVFRR